MTIALERPDGRRVVGAQIPTTCVPPARTPASVRPWRIAAQGAAAMAAGVGIGRFVYTPILPLMHDQAGLSPQLGAHLATANYAGYLLGALATIAAPGLTRSRAVLRGSFLVLAATLALMPFTRVGEVWLGLRFVAGVASVLIFVIAATALFGGLRAHAAHLVGWGFGGLGAGIALSGALVLALRASGTWQQAWWGATVLLLVCSALAWRLPMPGAAPISSAGGERGGGLRSFVALAISYTLEGTGYIVAGTFLVAAINANAPGWAGTGAWVLVGLTALPSAALWAWLNHTWSRPTLLVAALSVQSVGVALPALIGGPVAALVSAALFGATFVGIATLSLALGGHLRVPHAVAILTTGYSAGQMLGPLVVTPLLRHGYDQALVVSAGVLAVGALAAGALRVGFPHHLGPLPRRVEARNEGA